MVSTRPVLVAALLAHGALSAWAIGTGGYFGAFPPFKEVWTWQIFSDLVVSISLLWVMLYREARRAGRPLWKLWACGLGIVVAGSISPLVYLLSEPTLFRDPEGARR
jgi:hypothetical protein